MTKSPSPADREIGRRIRLRRMSIGMSRPALAAALGVTVQQVRTYETGSRRIGAGRLRAMARVLGVTLPGGPEGALAPGLGTAQGLRLVRAFGRIGDAGLRRRALALVETLAEIAGSARG